MGNDLALLRSKSGPCRLTFFGPDWLYHFFSMLAPIGFSLALA